MFLVDCLCIRPIYFCIQVDKFVTYTIIECPFLSAESCKSLKEAGTNLDGLHHINIPSIGSVQVFCDQSTDGGGWTVIQRRATPFSLSFERNWVEYENGFGKPDSEFWLGNKVIHELSKKQVEVQIVLKSRKFTVEMINIAWRYLVTSVISEIVL